MQAAKSGARRAAREAVGECLRMTDIRNLGITLAAALGLTFMVGNASAADRPVVVELFTSQSCYSCPPAERFLGELADRRGVIALEFHVDYWNDLSYGSEGRWKDLFSRPEFTRRQQDYNRRIRNQPGVYTPQMVIDGQFEKAGTREFEVLEAVQYARGRSKPRVSVAVRRDGKNRLSVVVDGAAQFPATIWLVRFRTAETTRVTRGENHGKILENHNIVTELVRIGEWRGRTATLDVPHFEQKPGEDCAVLVQDATPGVIFGAAQCPKEGA